MKKMVLWALLLWMGSWVYGGILSVSEVNPDAATVNSGTVVAAGVSSAATYTFSNLDVDEDGENDSFTLTINASHTGGNLGWDSTRYTPLINTGEWQQFSFGGFTDVSLSGGGTLNSNHFNFTSIKMTGWHGDESYSVAQESGTEAGIAQNRYSLLDGDWVRVTSEANIFTTHYFGFEIKTDTVQTVADIVADEKLVLDALIAAAETAGVDAQKEKMTARTAEIFLEFAAWDAANVGVNSNIFNYNGPTKNDAAASLLAAQELPVFEINEVRYLLAEATNRLTRLMAGEIDRKSIPKVDWSQVSHEGDHLTYNNRPVFLEYYTWKPETAALTEFHGNDDGYLLQHGYVLNDRGDFSGTKEAELKDKPTGTAGFIFMSHQNVPSWATNKYGSSFIMSEDKQSFVAYDIDHPGALEMNSLLISNAVPHIAGKKYAELGYMLCNEPHFDTTKKSGGNWNWSSGPVSEYTKDKFRAWLATKHASIEELNILWGSEFADFDSVTIDIPISEGLQGTPIWYDWIRFNMNRITAWLTWMRDEVHKYDPAAKTHSKIIPGMWADNERGWGIDLEALTYASEIIGNDCGAKYNNWTTTEDWESDYQFYWREICTSYDFMKSVSPNKMMFNSENHFVSTGKSRALDMDPAYIRATFWLGHTHGLDGSQIWFWPRQEDGTPRTSVYADGVTKDKSYWHSLIQQPRVVNEIHSTVMDLNSFSEEILALQRQRKPLRIFHSETSAINKPAHMDDEFELYEALHFDGLSLGYATENIIRLQDNSLWDAVLVYKTEYVTANERAALQSYLDGGGTIIMDSISLKQDEYGASLASLDASNGTLQMAASLAEMKEQSLALAAQKGALPDVKVSETNSVGKDRCTWNCVTNAAGNYVLSAVNLGKTTAVLDLSLPRAAKGIVCRDLLTGTELGSAPTLLPYGVLFVEIIPVSGWSDYVEQFGLSGVKNANQDHDSLTDWGEYVFGGDPSNANDFGSPPVFDAVSGTYTFSLIGDDSVVAHIRSTTNLVSNQWSTIGTVMVAETNGVLNAYTNTTGTTSDVLFLRLEIE